MISKALRNTSFSTSIQYICEKAESVRTLNIASENWKNAAREMRVVANLNTTKKCVYHSILSWSPDEEISDEMMFSAARKMLEKLGLEEHQSVMAVHRDRDHRHIHTVTNLVGFDGKAAKLSHDFHSRPVHARAIEKELNLQPYQPKKRDPKAQFIDEKINAIRLAAYSKNRPDFEKFLSEIGVQMTEKSSKSRAINYQFLDVETGAKIAGSRIDSALSSPTSAKAHFSKTPIQQTAGAHTVTEKKSTWDTSRNAAFQRAASTSQNWGDLRQNLQAEGITLEIITRSNGAQGLVFIDESGNRIAASKVSAELSFSKLSKSFEQQPQPQAQAAPPPKPKSPWEQYSEARAEHFSRIGKSPEQIKADLENIKESKEKLWKEYKYKTSLIPQCFEPKYRGIMRRIERNNFEKSKLRLEKQAQHLRDQRFPRFDDWKSGKVRPTPKPQKPTIFQKLKAFFNPIASITQNYHKNHTYHPKPQSSATPQIEIVSGMDFDMNDILFEASSIGTKQLTVVSSTYANQLRQANTTQDKSTRSNHYVIRNHDQR